MHASEVTPEVAARANELYWGSSRSVNQIADDMDLSKGALYGVIEPQPAGMGCPLCGDEVVYANRTAKERDILGCPTCDWDGSADETGRYDVHTREPASRSEASEARPSTPSSDGRPTRTRADGPRKETRADGRRPRSSADIDRQGGHDHPDADEAASDDGRSAEAGGRPAHAPRPLAADARFRTAVGGALVGAAVGLALVLWARRR